MESGYSFKRATLGKLSVDAIVLCFDCISVTILVVLYCIVVLQDFTIGETE